MKSKWTYKKSKQKLGISNFGGLSAVKNVWDSLKIDQHMEQLGFTKEGIPVNTLAFTYTCKPFTGSASNVQLANSDPDAVFSNVSGLNSINDSTISRFIFPCARFKTSAFRRIAFSKDFALRRRLSALIL